MRESSKREEDPRRNEKADVHLRAEIDHLRAELFVSLDFVVSTSSFPHRQKAEENLAMTEGELDKHTALVTDLTRKVICFLTLAPPPFAETTP